MASENTDRSKLRSKALEAAISKVRRGVEGWASVGELEQLDAALVEVGTAARELELETCIGYLERRAEAIRSAVVEESDPRKAAVLNVVRDTGARTLEAAALELVRLEHYK